MLDPRTASFPDVLRNLSRHLDLLVHYGQLSHGNVVRLLLLHCGPLRQRELEIFIDWLLNELGPHIVSRR